MRFSLQRGRWWTIALFGLLLLMNGCGTLPDPEQPSPPTPQATAVPSATPDPAADFVGYLDAERGIALQHPPDWALRERPVLQLASDAALFDNTGGVTSGALLALTQAPVELADAADLGRALFDLTTGQGEVRVIEGPDTLTIGGQEAAALTVVAVDGSGIEFTAYYTVIRRQDAAILVSAVTPDYERFEPLLRAIVRSIIVSDPRPAPPTLTPAPSPTPSPAATADPEATPTVEATPDPGAAIPQFTAPVPAAFIQYRSPDGFFTIGYPPDWLVADDDPAAILFAPNEPLLRDNDFSDGGGTVWFYSFSAQTAAPLDPVLLLERFITNFPIYEGFNIVDAPAPLTINGQPGATSRYEVTFLGAAMIADYYVVVNNNRMVFVVSLLTLADLDTFRPLVEGMVASLRVE